MEVYLSRKADKQLRHIPSSLYTLIIEAIEKLAKTPLPTGVKKLTGREGWRIRIGDYRILYTIDFQKKEVTILSISHRKDAYRTN